MPTKESIPTSFKVKPIFRNKPKDEKLKKHIYKRYFIFFDIPSLFFENGVFNYSIRQSGLMPTKILKGPYYFNSRIKQFDAKKDLFTLKDSDELTVVTFGDHDKNGEDVHAKLSSSYYDLLILLGDYSYDVYEDFGVRGDDYFEWMEPLMTRAPIILTPGNHENFQKTNFFNQRFMMPGTRQPEDNNLFACETKRLQIMGLNLDYLLARPELSQNYQTQIDTVLKDFDERKNNRFSFYISHRPFHCKGNYDECNQLASTFPEIEKSLISSEINVNLWGHVHHYERLDAIYNHQKLPKKNLMSLIVGTGGNKEGITLKGWK